MADATNSGVIILSYFPGHRASSTVARVPAMIATAHTGTMAKLSPVE